MFFLLQSMATLEGKKLTCVQKGDVDSTIIREWDNNNMIMVSTYVIMDQILLSHREDALMCYIYHVILGPLSNSSSWDSEFIVLILFRLYQQKTFSVYGRMNV